MHVRITALNSKTRQKTNIQPDDYRWTSIIFTTFVTIQLIILTDFIWQVMGACHLLLRGVMFSFAVRTKFNSGTQLLQPVSK